MLVTPSLTFVLFGSLREGVPVTDKVAQLPGYLSDTFLHLDFGYAAKFHEPRGRVLLDTMPVDIALLVVNVIVIERAFNLPGFFRMASIGQFNGLDDKEPPISAEDVQALIVEASLLIALTMFLADVLRAKLDPQARM